MDLMHLDSKLKRLPVRIVQGSIAALLPAKIRTGPFAGLRVHKNNYGSALLPKLLGTYERELAERVRASLLDKATDGFIDVGCAGGYYLQLASQLRRELSLVGIDFNLKAIAASAKALAGSRQQLTLLCERASGSRVAALLANFLRPTLMIDIEGGEIELFDELQPEDLQHATVFLEVHEFAGASLRGLTNFFQNSHTVEIIRFARYAVSESRNTPGLAQLVLTHELRHPNTSYLVAYPQKLA